MRLVLRSVIVIAALVAGTAAVVPTVSAMQPPTLIPVQQAQPGVTSAIDGLVASSVGSLGDAISTLSYWTPERMRAAQPASAAWRDRREGALPLLGGDLAAQGLPDEVVPHAAGRTNASMWSHGGAVTRTTGKVFFTLDGSDYVCSGSAVHSANRDTVLTAGHCVNSGPGEFASQWVFVPGYSDGDRPYGTWTARRLFAPSAWTQRGDIDRDVGFAVVDTRGDGAHLGDVVGGQPIAFDAARSQVAYSFGYPALGQYDGYSLIFCAGKLRQDEYGSRDQGMHCDMTDGSSGGPWLSKFDPATGTGVLTSVNSFGYDGMPDVMWGPYLDDTIHDVFAKAQHT